MSAPLGGDRLALDITAATRARLEVTTAAATIALRGPTTAPATYDVRIRVGDHATLHWLPEPLISTRGSTLHQTFAVELAPTSHLLHAREQLLGRSGEPPGHLTTRLTVRRGGDRSSTSTPPTATRHRHGTAPPSSEPTAPPGNSFWSTRSWTRPQSRMSSATTRQRDTRY